MTEANGFLRLLVLIRQFRIQQLCYNRTSSTGPSLGQKPKRYIHKRYSTKEKLIHTSGLSVQKRILVNVLLKWPVWVCTVLIWKLSRHLFTVYYCWWNLCSPIKWLQILTNNTIGNQYETKESVTPCSPKFKLVWHHFYWKYMIIYIDLESTFKGATPVTFRLIFKPHYSDLSYPIQLLLDGKIGHRT